MPKANIRRQERKLTARFVETVSEPGKYFDGHGLFLRVRTNGSKQWVQRITIRGKRCELGLGSPPAVPLAKARERALENHGKAMLGGDPLAERREASEKLSFSQAVEKYLSIKLTEFRNEKHRKQWRSTLDTYAIPILGSKLVAEIAVQDILRVLEPIWWEKTETAKRLRGRIENVLSWATVAGHRSGDNPARWKGNLSEILPKPAKVANKDNQPALALRDVSRWWVDLSNREGMAAKALQFAMLTASRSGAVRLATWDEIDLTARIWTIQPGRASSKIPASGNPHRVPLTEEAISLLKSLPRITVSHHIFFAPRGGALSDMSLSAVMRRLHKAEIEQGLQGYLDPRSKRPAVPHGLRSTFRQWAAEQGYPRDMAELALAHTVGSDVERAYQRSDMLERRREMMSAWAEFLKNTEGGAKKLIKLRLQK
ncbi:tyrosine-type recombinase/integrase [Lutimaribacter saemankumensis]|uniref:Integrase n=1 Tax=Lutimaribacter saemankumensis TaxID=490829 RepID=A0A1G8RFB4_9RHOB|nr:site-specific integrase [Lutimaribacter saemankumensis]SDJ15215.1 Integrase [Lutimaribacter saemankumensis]